jgi:hypothetical protein
MWEAAGNGPVDGVLAVDAHAFAMLMRVTGAVTVGERFVTPDAALEFVLHDQYFEFIEEADFEESQGRRRDALGELATQVFNRLNAEASVDEATIQVFDDIAAGRHILAWSADPEQQAAFEAAGVDGAIGPDSMLVSLINRSGNKLDWFMHVSSAMTVTPTDHGTDVHVDVTLVNDAPGEGPAHAIGPYTNSGLQPGEYLGVLSLNMPAGAVDAGVEGPEPVIVDGSDGESQVLGARVVVPRGTQDTVTFRFTLPADIRSVRVEASARAEPIRWSLGAEQWVDDRARTVEW